MKGYVTPSTNRSTCSCPYDTGYLTTHVQPKEIKGYLPNEYKQEYVTSYIMNKVICDYFLFLLVY